MENFENVFQNSSVENNRSPLDGVFCRERGIHLKETGGGDGAGFHYRTATRNWQNEGNVTLSFLRFCAVPHTRRPHHFLSRSMPS